MDFTVKLEKALHGRLITTYVQELIDECATSGGGKIIFKKGEYVLSTVFLKSNIEIVITMKVVKITGGFNIFAK